MPGANKWPKDNEVRSRRNESQVPKKGQQTKKGEKMGFSDNGLTRPKIQMQKGGKDAEKKNK